MKRYLIALIFPALLIGCASSDESLTATPATADNTTLSNPDNATLTSHVWVLQDARDPQGMRITPLFVQADKPVQLAFDNGRISVRNTCNTMGGQYSLHENRMTLGAMVSTKMMCIDSRVAALDDEVGKRLRGVNTYRITSADRPVLTITTPDREILTFAGVQTPAARYGSEGEILFLEVAPKTTPCSHPLIPSKQCLKVREVHYDSQGLKTGKPGQWQAFYQDIEGYRFQPGIRNVLRVKRYKIANPPADSADSAYVLDMVVESQLVKTKKQARKSR